jgi:MFS family permease
MALKFNIRYLAVIGLIIQLMSLGILMSTGDLTFIYVYAALFGLSNGVLSTATPTIVGEYYGRERYAQVMGVVLGLCLAVEAAAPAIAGFIYDVTTEYILAFAIVATFSSVGLVCISLARPPKLP